MTTQPAKHQACPWGWWRCVDCLLVPALIVGLAYEPNFLHGQIDYLEAGQYLGPVNGIFRGEVPYRDSYTLFGPLFLYVPALLMALFGKTVAVLSTYFHVTSILNIVIAYAVGRLVCRHRLIGCLIPVVTLVEAFHPFWSSRWGGLRVGAGLLVLSCLSRYAQHGRRSHLVAAGVLTSLSLLYSTDVGMTACVTTAGLLLWMCLSRQGSSARKMLGDGAAYVVGAGVAILPFATYYASQGALWPYATSALWEMPLRHLQVWDQGRVPSVVAAVREAPTLMAFLAGGTFKIYLPLLLYSLLLIYLGVKWWRRDVTPQVTVVFLFVVYGLLQYRMAFRAIHGPQFQTALPPLIIVSALCVERCVDSLREGAGKIRRGLRPPMGATMLSLAVVTALSGYFLFSEKRYYGSLTGWCWYQRHKAQLVPANPGPVWASAGGWAPCGAERCGAIRVPAPQAVELEGVTRFLLEQTAPTEPVFTFPEHGMFNFLADRPRVSRFDIAGLAWTSPAWQRELLDAVREQQPRVVVKGRPLSNLARSIRREEELLPEVGAYLKTHYRVVRSFPTIDILERL